jgi:IclR family acetate operon transcriptional repressor
VTPYTVVDPEQLRAAIRLVRERGYAEAERSNDIDSAGVAAGIVGSSGKVIAAISVVAPAGRFVQVRDAAVVAVTAAAAQISAALRQVGVPYSELQQPVARGKR